jgi:hypothetical protein
MGTEFRGQDPNRVFAMTTSHLDELVQDHHLAVSICGFLAQPYGRAQFPSRNQLDPSPHLDLPKQF